MEARAEHDGFVLADVALRHDRHLRVAEGVVLLVQALRVHDDLVLLHADEFGLSDLEGDEGLRCRQFLDEVGGVPAVKLVICRRVVDLHAASGGTVRPLSGQCGRLFRLVSISGKPRLPNAVVVVDDAALGEIPLLELVG